MSTDRERFEAWAQVAISALPKHIAKELGVPTLPLYEDPDGYRWFIAELLFSCWQAARSEPRPDKLQLSYRQEFEQAASILGSLERGMNDEYIDAEVNAAWFGFNVARNQMPALSETKQDGPILDRAIIASTGLQAAQRVSSWGFSENIAVLPSPDVDFVSDLKIEDGASCSLCGTPMQFKCPKCGLSPVPTTSSMTYIKFGCRDAYAAGRDSMREEAANGWISVSDRLPDEHVRVAIWFLEHSVGGVEYYARFGERSCGHWRPEGGNGNFDDRVSYWRIIEPPAIRKL